MDEALLEEVGKKLFDLHKQFSEEDREIRDRLIQRSKRLEYFWKGYHYLAWSETAGDFRTPDLDPEDFQDYLEDLFYTKVYNVYRAHGESIVSALSTTIPTVVYTPDDADNPDDIETAKAYKLIERLIQRHNKPKLLIAKAIYTMYNQGIVFGYNQTKKDKKFGTFSVDKFEPALQGMCPECQQEIPDFQPEPEVDDAAQPMQCPNCGNMMTPQVAKFPRLVGTSEQPKARQILNVYGLLNVAIPIWCRTQEEVPYLCLREDIHVTQAKKEFPDIADDIKDETDPENYEVWGRLPVENRSQERRGLVVRTKVWFRPEAFYGIKDEDLRDAALEAFPDGLRATFINNLVAELAEENLDDVWTISFDPRSSHLHADPVGNPLVPVQETLNTVFNLTTQTIEQGIPETFADPDVVDFERYKRTEKRPGQLYPAKARIGQPLDQSFVTVKTATVSAEIEKFSAKLEQTAQFVVGSFPSIYGGQMTGSRTAAEYQMSRQQALQRLSTTWAVVTQFWADFMSRAVVAFARDMETDEKLTTKQGDSFVTDWIRKISLNGTIGSVEPEASEQFPTNWAEQRDVIIQLLTMGNDQINAALFHPANATFIASLVGLPELYIPGNADRTKQLNEIKMLLQTEPIPGEQEGAMVPAVPTDPQVDDHEVHIEICKTFLNSERGVILKTQNPQGYMNVVAHLNQHQMDLMQLMNQQFGASPAGMPPETAAQGNGV